MSEQKDALTASEALYGFAGWLTSREKKITMSSTNDAAAVAALVKIFCVANALADPREEWAENLTHPRE